MISLDAEIIVLGREEGRSTSSTTASPATASRRPNRPPPGTPPYRDIRRTDELDKLYPIRLSVDSPGRIDSAFVPMAMERIHVDHDDDAR